MAAMWSSQEGSLLLWAWVLSIASSLALYATRNKLREIVPYATAVMAGIASFFTGLMLFAGGVNPFATLSPVPLDGIGLNPLLQHPSMMIHPPMLYSGYVAFTIPFAFAIGALITRRLDASWIRATRRFALIAWAFLGFGLLLGARWSYTELGWGGYWAWDPVENAALMPWLIGTAFLHSVMVQEKRGMLKVWNACLIVATFSLALLGTFLVRSGVLQSIHAFGDSTVGPYILGLIGVVLIGSTALIVSRLDDLRSEKRIDSLVSRESVFLVNNLLLVALCAAIFWGTFFPLISEFFTGNKSSLAAPVVRPLHDAAGDRARPLHRDRAAARLAPGQLGHGQTGLPRADRGGGDRRRRARPLQRRRLASPGRWRSSSSPPSPWSASARSSGAAPRRGARSRAARWPAALVGVVSRNRRRYGGYIVHIGIAVLLIGIAASSSFQTKRDVKLRPGQSAVVDGRKVTYVQADGERRQTGLQRRRGAAGAEGRRNVHRAPDPSLLPADRGPRRRDQQLLRRRSRQRHRLQGRPLHRLLDGEQPQHHRRPAPRPRRRRRLQKVRQRRPRRAVAVPGDRRDDAGCARQSPTAPAGAGADRTAAARDGEADRRELPHRRRARRPSA